MPKVVAWRRDFHAEPRAVQPGARTAGVVADHLRQLGLEVRTGVGGHGVVGVLRGGRPGRTVALRADMDALPVTEQVDLPFASKVRATYDGQDVGVMHAVRTRHAHGDAHGRRRGARRGEAQLAGTGGVPLPAERGGDPGKPSGAKAMLAAGVMDGPLKPDAVFGLHVGITPAEAGHLTYRTNGFMAAADFFRVTVRGRQTHGSTPWAGVDPVTAARTR
jgi:amidohydrolase